VEHNGVVKNDEKPCKITFFHNKKTIWGIQNRFNFLSPTGILYLSRFTSNCGFKFAFKLLFGHFYRIYFSTYCSPFPLFDKEMAGQNVDAPKNTNPINKNSLLVEFLRIDLTNYSSKK
jgi:hypothetical protein